MFFEANREITKEYLKELRRKRRIDTQIFEDVSPTLMEILNANEDKDSPSLRCNQIDKEN